MKVNLSIILLFLFLISCEENEVVVNKEQPEKIDYSLKTLNKKQVANNPKIAQALQQISENRILLEANERMASNDIYDFTVNTENVKYIESENYHSYSFRISRSNTESDNLENLLLTYNKEKETYDVYLVEYDFSAEEFKSLKKEDLAKRQTYFYPLDFDASTLIGTNTRYTSGYLICLEYWEYQGGEPRYNPNDIEGAGWVLVSTDCEYVSGGGSSGYGGSDYSDGGNYTGSGGTGGSGAGDSTEDPKYEIIGIALEEDIALQLETLLEEDPFALIEDIPCEELEKWKAVANTPVPQAVIDRLVDLESESPDLVDSFSPYDDWEIQNLEDAAGIVVNMDYFSVDVTLPGNLTPEFLLEHIRTTMLDDLEGAQFTPHTMLFGEDNRWLNTPVGSILSINMVDDGSVICIKSGSSSWTFATISDPRNFTHPISGNREFGFINNGDGSYQFYTRGVDRLTGYLETGIREIGTFALEEDLMNLANPVWESFQANIVEYVESIEGTANIVNKNYERPDYGKLQDVLSGYLPISEYDGCN